MKELFENLEKSVAEEIKAYEKERDKAKKNKDTQKEMHCNGVIDGLCLGLTLFKEEMKKRCNEIEAEGSGLI